MPVSSVYSLDVFVAFGGSSTEWAFDSSVDGWVARLAHKYSRRVDVLNRGFAGYNTRWAKHIFFNLFPKTTSTSTSANAITITGSRNSPSGQISTSSGNGAVKKLVEERMGLERIAKVKLVVIFLGVNDAALPGSASGSFVPLDEFRANLNEMIDHLHSPQSQYYSPDTRFLLITPPPVCEPMWAATLAKIKAKGRGQDEVKPANEAVLDRREENTKKYAEVVIAVGQSRGIAVIDLFSALKNQISNSSKTNDKWGGYKDFFYDGLHLSSKGNKLLAELVEDAIAANLPELSPKNLPPVGPSPRAIFAAQERGSLVRSRL